MKQIILIGALFLWGFSASAQESTRDTVIHNGISVVKDERVDLLGKKMAEYNESLSDKIQMVKGYRLMLLSTADRAQAMQLRSNLLQQYPDQKVYMVFVTPYIKIKFGNFTDKSEAEKMRKQLAKSKIVPGNIYLLPEMIELRPDKSAASEE